MARSLSLALLAILCLIGLSSCSSSSSIATAPAITLALAPVSANLEAGQSTQFSATVSNTSNTMVIWEVNFIVGGNATVGTISASGLYTAPSLVATTTTINITAAAAANTSITSTATVTLSPAPLPVAVSVSPSTSTVQVAATQQFTATVSNAGDLTVTWEVNNVAGGNAAVGTISSSGLYTAPATVPTPATVTVTAISVAAPAASGTATVTITPAPLETVVVTPAAISLQTGATQSFTAVVSNATDTTVTWEVNTIPGGNLMVGTISASGMYTAPALVPSTPTVMVMAVSNANTTIFGTAAVTITSAPPPVTVVVAPKTFSLQVTQTKQFTATVTHATDTSVLWQVNQIQGGNSTVGTISSTGLYTAPGTVPAPATVTVTAVSNADPTKTDSATVTVTPVPTPVSVSVTPSTINVIVGQSAQFAADVSNTSNLSVVWQANLVQGGNSTIGTISSAGLYTAPVAVPSPAAVTITAVSNADPTKSGSAVVTVQPQPQLGISISPNPGPAVRIGLSSTYSAALANDPGNTIINWSLGCINTDDESPPNPCAADESDGANSDGPGLIMAPGGTNGLTVSNSSSVIYTAPLNVYFGGALANGCPDAVSPSTAYVPLTATATNGTQTATQTVCVQVNTP